MLGGIGERLLGRYDRRRLARNGCVADCSKKGRLFGLRKIELVVKRQRRKSTGTLREVEQLVVCGSFIFS